MPIQCSDNRWRRIVLLASVVLCCNVPAMHGVRAQSLDLDSHPDAPAPPPSQSGGLDRDANPNAPAAPLPAAQALPQSNVQQGVPPSNAAAPQQMLPAPAAMPAQSPAPPATIVVQPATPPATIDVQPATSPPATVVVQPATSPPATVVVQPAPTQPIILDHPRVIDTARLEAGNTSVELYGVEGLGGGSAQGLQAFLGSASLRCQAHLTAGFVCLMPDGTDVAQVALVNGAAKTAADAPDTYREQEAAAQAARRGIWANLPPPPETLTHPVVLDTATLSAGPKTYMLDGIIGFQQPYASQLQGYIVANGDSVTCALQDEPGHYVCLLPDGTDVAKVALVNGAARVAQDAPDSYRVQQLDALNNRRGYWMTAPAAVITAALLPPAPEANYALVAGDDGGDGITYVGGVPVALIDGEAAFLVYGDDDLGWGYYDHYHHWHGAPDRYRRHMEHFHPGGHGLRGYEGFHHDAAFRGREDAMRGREDMMRHDAAVRGREDMMRHDAAVRGREDMMRHDAAVRGREEMIRHDAAVRGREETIQRDPAIRREEAMRPGAVRPGVPEAAGRPAMGGALAAARPSPVAMAAGRPAIGAGAVPNAGFMHPAQAASAGGFHPGVAPAAMHVAAPAPHIAAPSGGGQKHK